MKEISLENARDLLSKLIISKDNQRELEFCFTTDSSGNFFITNERQKVKRGQFYLIYENEYYIELIFDGDFPGFSRGTRVLINEPFIEKLYNCLEEYNFH